jgi:hypothetical protein
MPKFLLALYGDESVWANMPQEDVAQALKEYFQFGDEVERAGALIAGEGLQPTATAITVDQREGKATTSDGPFVETKETLGGFYLLECEDQAEAIEWAKKIPAGVAVEVRPIQEYERP